VHVHAQLYFTPLQTSQFLSFAAIGLPAELMGDQCHQAAIRLYLHVSTKEKKTHELLDSSMLVQNARDHFLKVESTTFSLPDPLEAG
jgi:hypothetical protein